MSYTNISVKYNVWKISCNEYFEFNYIPLKGTAIFFVKGDTGYSLLYLAKQIDYPQQLPMIQQMINSFQAGNATTTSGTGVGSSSGTTTNSGQ